MTIYPKVYSLPSHCFSPGLEKQAWILFYGRCLRINQKVAAGPTIRDEKVAMTIFEKVTKMKLAATTVFPLIRLVETPERSFVNNKTFKVGVKIGH